MIDQFRNYTVESYGDDRARRRLGLDNKKLKKYRCSPKYRNRLSKKHKNPLGNTLASTTTVVAVEFGSGIVLRADGRVVATEFGLVTANVRVPVGKWIAVGCFGDAYFIQMLKKEFAKDLAGRKLSVTEVAREVKVRMENHVKVVHSTHIGVLVVGRENNKWPIIKLETAGWAPIVLEKIVDKRYATVGSGSEREK